MLQVINKTKIRVPRQRLQKLWKFLATELRKEKSLAKKMSEPPVLVFLSRKEAQKLNLQYRKKNYATDVLSFSSIDGESLGELILCSEVLQRQAREHGLSFRDELTYMVIHGVLHLLGLDHERSSREEKKMFALQDRLFQQFLE